MKHEAINSSSGTDDSGPPPPAPHSHRPWAGLHGSCYYGIVAVDVFVLLLLLFFHYGPKNAISKDFWKLAGDNHSLANQSIVEQTIKREIMNNKQQQQQ